MFYGLLFGHLYLLVNLIVNYVIQSFIGMHGSMYEYRCSLLELFGSMMKDKLMLITVNGLVQIGNHSGKVAVRLSRTMLVG